MSRNEYVELESVENLGKEADSWSPLAKSAKNSITPGISVELRDHNNHESSGADNYPLISETPLRKTGKTTSKLLALRHFALFHLPAVAGTLVLLSLYIVKIRWYNPPVDALNALQFTAKAHEALILISLGDVLLHRIFHGLHHKDSGTPVGFLASPFSLGAPLQYLVSNQLWSPIIRSSNDSRRHRITGVMIISVALLSIGASPLSAVAMIPRQRWWDNPGVDIGRGVHVMQVDGSVYTTNLTKYQPPYLDEGWEPKYWSRPSQNALLQGLGLLTLYNEDEKGNFPWVNVSYNNYQADYQNRPISLRTWGKSVIATCAMSAVSEFMGIIWKVWDDPSEEWLITAEHQPVDPTRRKGKQPLVSVECSESFLNNGIATFGFDSLDEKKNISLDTNQYPGLKDQVKNVSDAAGPIGYHFLNFRDKLNLPISTDILFVNSFNNTDPNDQKKKPPEAGLSLCLITASWTEADNRIEFSKSNDVRSHLTFRHDKAMTIVKGSYGTDDFIAIEPEWMSGIASLSNRLSNKTSYEEIAGYCGGDEGFIDICLQLTLSLHVTDAISQIGEYIWKDEDDEKHLEPGLDVIRLGMYIYAYGYDFYGSWGIPLAFAVLLLHVIVVLVHLIQILVSDHPWQGSNWDTFGDMLVLALGSKAPDETPSKSKIWKKTLTVNDGGKEGQAQMLLQDDEGY